MPPGDPLPGIVITAQEANKAAAQRAGLSILWRHVKLIRHTAEKLRHLPRTLSAAVARIGSAASVVISPD